MATNQIAAVRNAKTGSYTVRVPKSARTGRFVAPKAKPQGRIEVQTSRQKTS